MYKHSINQEKDKIFTKAYCQKCDVGLYLGECSEDCHSKLKATGSDFVE
jgi:hypothetical protein